MKQGKTLVELATELDRQNSTKRDFVSDTRKIALVEADGPKGIADTPVTRLRLNGQDTREEFDITPHAHSQIATRIGIPKKYYDRMLTEAPELLRENVNHWFDEKPERRMVRTLDGSARAFLSNRYRRMDNFDLLQTALPILQECAPDLIVASSQVTDRNMYLKVTFPSIERKFDTPARVGDVVRAGLSIRNCEIGGGKLIVARFAEVLWCTNGMTSGRDLAKHHVGRTVGDGSDEPTELYSDATLKAEDEALWRKVGDVVRAAATDLQFDRLVDNIQAAAFNDARLVRPEKAIEELGETFGLNETERGGILAHLIEGGDLSKWGTVQAVTRTAQDLDSYDRATEFEDLGGRLLELPQKEWARIAASN